MQPHPLLQQIGSKIKQVRTSKNMTQLALASLCQFEKASISKIESGKRNMSVLTLSKISEVLETDMSEFFKK